MTDLAVALPAYLVFVLAAVVLPGIALQRLARVPVDPALVIPLGQAAVACAYGGCLVLGVPQAAWVAVLLLDGAVLWNRGGGGPAGPALRGALPAVLALIAVLALTRYPLNRPTAAGDFVLDPLAEDDTALHAGMTWELAHGYPPQVPGLSGVRLHYHLGAPLVRAAATRFAGIGPYDLLTRFQPTLDGIALILVLRSVVHAMGGGPLAVALAGWAPLAGDFAFLFVAHPAMRYWTDFLHGNVLLAALLGNNVIPALACAMGSLVALHRATEDRRRGWLALSCALAAATPLFKIFVGAHLGLALGAMLLRPSTRRAALAPVAALVAAAAMLAGGGGTQTMRMAVEPLVPVGEALPGWPYPAWAVAWVVASIGLRWSGVPLALASVRSPRPLPFAVGVMALSGWVIGLLLHVTARDTMPGMKAFNQASYFLEQGGLLLWTFTALQLGKTLAASPRLVLVAPLAALVAFADTAQFVARKQERPVKHVPADVLRGMAALAAASRPGDVVLQRADPRFPPPPVVFIGRRVPYTRALPYLPQFAPRAELEARLHAVRAFFSTTDPQAALAIAAGLQARYLCLYDEDRVSFPPRAVLQPIYEGPQTRVYRVLW